MLSDYDLLVKAGLLMPKAFARMDHLAVGGILRSAMSNNPDIVSKYTFYDLLSILTKNIQRARFESFLIKLAEALDGYDIYFPVYLDFRGRIYRAGICNFHERDLVKAMLVFAPFSGGQDLTSEEMETLHIATAFQFKKFPNYEAASNSNWYASELQRENLEKSSLYKLAGRARHPFQFLSNMTLLSDYQYKDWLAWIPIHMDASASAYQSMCQCSLLETR
jgi:DNA-directed RNA polymerase